MPSGNETTLFVVCKRDLPPTGQFGYGSVFITALGYSTTGGGNFMQLNSQGANYNINYNAASLDAVVCPNTTDSYLICVVKSATQSSIYVDGVLISTNIGTQNISSPFVSIGGWFDTFYNGQIGEVIMYNEAVNATKRTQVTNHLMSKYSL